MAKTGIFFQYLHSTLLSKHAGLLIRGRFTKAHLSILELKFIPPPWTSLLFYWKVWWVGGRKNRNRESGSGGRDRSFESSEVKLGFIFRQSSSQRDHEKPLFCVVALFPENLEAFVVELTQWVSNRLRTPVPSQFLWWIITFMGFPLGAGAKYPSQKLAGEF